MSDEARRMLARFGVQIVHSDYCPDGAINLAHSDVGNEDLQALTGTRDFAELNLKGTTISDAGVATISQMEQLETLELGGTLISDSALSHLSELRKLEQLGVGCDQG